MQIGEISNEVQSMSKVQQYNKQRDELNIGQVEREKKIIAEEASKDTQNLGTLVDDSTELSGKDFYKNNEFKFSIHERTKQVMIKIIDRKTKEVVKEIPEEKILDMVAQMCEHAGLYVDEKK